jgi:hypothetical protein
MAIYKRGGVWWYEFVFQGQRIRESSNSDSKSAAVRIERERRRQLELGVAGVKDVKAPMIFSVAARQYLETNSAHWSANNARIEGANLGHLLPHFGRLLLSDINATDIAQYQGDRKKQNASPKTVNMELGSLRAIMRKHRLWANIQPDVRMLRTKSDIGRALSEDEQHRLVAACRKSRSRSLYPAVLLSLHTGLRSAAAASTMAPGGSLRENRHGWQEQDGRRRRTHCSAV